MKEEIKYFVWWVGSIKYTGYILKETDTHFVVDDVRIGEIELPKAVSTKQQISKEEYFRCRDAGKLIIQERKKNYNSANIKGL